MPVFAQDHARSTRPLKKTISALVTCHPPMVELDSTAQLSISALKKPSKKPKAKWAAVLCCLLCSLSPAFAQSWEETNKKLLQLYRDGLYTEAAALGERALIQARRSFGNQHPNYGIAINNLAVIYRSLGYYEQALPLQLLALKVTETVSGKSDPEYPVRLNNLAILYEAMGQINKAGPLYQEALHRTGALYGRSDPRYSLRLNNLANFYTQNGEAARALPLLDSALRITGQALGKKHIEYAERLNNLAFCHKSLKQYDQAYPLYLEALKITRRKLGETHPDYGNRLNNLAALFEETGQNERALDCYLEARKVFATTLGTSHAAYAVVTNNLASLHLKTGHEDEAIPLFLESLSNVYRQIERAFSFTSEQEKQRFVSQLQYQFEIYHNAFLSFSNRHPTMAGHAMDIELALKGLVMQSTYSMRKAMLESGDYSLVQRYNDWLQLRSVLARQYGLPLANRIPDLAQLEEKSGRIEGELQRLSARFRMQKTLHNVRFTDLQKILQPGEAVVEFTSFRVRGVGRWTDSIRYIALLLRHGDSLPRAVPLFFQHQLDSIIHFTQTGSGSYVPGLYRGGRTVSATNNRASPSAGLYELIWKPLEPLLPAGTHVYFTPAGSLYRLAFAAISVNDSTRLSDRYRLQQLSSGTMFMQKHDSIRFPKSLLLFGGIDYNAVGDTSGADADSLLIADKLPEVIPVDEWDYLPGTLREVEAIHTLAIGHGLTSRLIGGDTATESRFKRLCTSEAAEIVHIATHGYFQTLSDAPVNNHPMIHSSGSGTFNDPLRRAGLVFAGAQSPAATKKTEDGVLNAFEISHLYLAKTRLVCLSACETGLGDIEGNEGVMGLQRAFKLAGVPYLIMSLWKIPDAATAQFMEYLYASWFTGGDLENAFRMAQQQMKLSYPDNPDAWAGLILVH